MSWDKMRFGDAVMMISGKTPSKSNVEYWSGNIPWISASSMRKLFVNNSNEKVTDLALKESGIKYVEKGTPLLLVRGSMLHQRIPISIPVVDVTINQDVKALKLKTEKIDQDFFVAWLLSSENLLLEKVEFTGIGAGKLDTEVLNNLVIPLPNLKYQKKIGQFISNINKKIELNNQMNDALEALAASIFKEWFIDFGPVKAKEENRIPIGMDSKTAELFPKSFIKSKSGMIPNQWFVNRYIDSIEVISGGTPSTAVPEYWGGEIPWFSVADCPSESSVWVLDTHKKITANGLSSSRTKLLDEGVVILTARGTVGKLAMVGSKMAMNQSCYALKSRDGFHFFNYFLIKSLVNSLKNKSYGSIFDTITIETISTLEFINPEKKVIENFEKTVTPFLLKIKQNIQENNCLIKTRNLLLPKLMMEEFTIE